MIDLNNYLTSNLYYLKGDFKGLEARAKSCNDTLDQIASALYESFLKKGFTQKQKNNLAPFCREFFYCLDMESNQFWISKFCELWNVTDDKDTLLSIIFHSEKGAEIFNNLTPVERVKYSGPWIRPMIKLSNTELFPRFALLQIWKSTPKEAKKALYDKIINTLNSFNADYSVCLSELVKDQDFLTVKKTKI